MNGKSMPTNHRQRLCPQLDAGLPSPDIHKMMMMTHLCPLCLLRRWKKTSCFVPQERLIALSKLVTSLQLWDPPALLISKRLWP